MRSSCSTTTSLISVWMSAFWQIRRSTESSTTLICGLISFLVSLFVSSPAPASNMMETMRNLSTTSSERISIFLIGTTCKLKMTRTTLTWLTQLLVESRRSYWRARILRKPSRRITTTGWLTDLKSTSTTIWRIFCSCLVSRLRVRSILLTWLCDLIITSFTRGILRRSLTDISDETAGTKTTNYKNLYIYLQFIYIGSQNYNDLNVYLKKI